MSDNIIILARHGERIDRSGEIQRSTKYDPELTKKGNELAKNIGVQIAKEFKEYIEKNGIKLYSSPFTRALETALSMRNEMEDIVPDKKEQNLTIIKELGEWAGQSNYDFFKDVLYYKNGNSEKETKLYEEFVLKKMTLKNIKYNLNYINYGEADCFPESQQQVHQRYVNVLCKLLDEIKGKEGNLIIVVAHGETLCAMNQYLMKLMKECIIRNGLKEDDPKSKWPDFLNNITGENQKYCNSFCYRITSKGDVSYYKTILPTNL